MLLQIGHKFGLIRCGAWLIIVVRNNGLNCNMDYSAAYGPHVGYMARYIAW